MPSTLAAMQIAGFTAGPFGTNTYVVIASADSASGIKPCLLYTSDAADE